MPSYILRREFCEHLVTYTEDIAHMEHTDVDRYFNRRRGLWELWIGLLAAPVAWLLHLQISYLLAAFTCDTGWEFMKHVVTLLTLVFAAVGGWIAWCSWQRTGREWPKKDEGGVLGRSRFMAASGVALSALFFLVIIAEGIPNFFLDACMI